MNLPGGLWLVLLTWWGWQVELLPLGIAFGLVMEAPRQFRLRWGLQTDDFRRLWNVTILLFVGAGLYLFFSQGGWGAATELIQNPAQGVESVRSAARIGLRFLQWLPMLLYPFVAAHRWSDHGWLPWATVSPLLHRRNRRAGMLAVAPPEKGFHPAHPYALLVCFSASASDRHPALFFPVLTVVVAWMLWQHRPPRSTWVQWTATLGAAVTLAFLAQHALLWLYRQVVQWEAQLINRAGGQQFDANLSITDLDSVGRRKLSARIVLRVYAPPGNRPPERLREAVFTEFRSPYWTHARKDFQPVSPQPDQQTWRLGPTLPLTRTVVVSRYTRQGDAMLAMPAGAAEIRELPAGGVETNRLTATRVVGALPLVTYTVRYAEQAGTDGIPDEEDGLAGGRGLREVDRAAVERLATQLGLRGMKPAEAMETVARHLRENYTYSLGGRRDQSAGEKGVSALSTFLFETRRGHCELFATATTLLLREAGIPARYVVGYAVQEPMGDHYVVRGRHAHAWALAFVDGRWLEVDNTPAGWAAAEQGRAPFWEPVYDWLSGAWLAFSRWRQGGSQWRLYVFALGIGLLAYMAWRELRGGRWRRRRPGTPGGALRYEWPGMDSEFYALERQLARHSGSRHPGTPLGSWVRLLQEDAAPDPPALERLLGLHYRLRFDPAGLSVAERDELRRGVARLLDRLALD